MLIKILLFIHVLGGSLSNAKLLPVAAAGIKIRHVDDFNTKLLAYSTAFPSLGTRGAALTNFLILLFSRL